MPIGDSNCLLELMAQSLDFLFVELPLGRLTGADARFRLAADLLCSGTFISVHYQQNMFGRLKRDFADGSLLHLSIYK
ncbi:MAG: hypothetical protein AB8B54_10325 [Sphingorhabdus sp.]